MSLQEHFHIDWLVQERCNSSVLAVDLQISCINPSVWIIMSCNTCTPGLYWQICNIYVSYISSEHHYEIKLHFENKYCDILGL